MRDILEADDFIFEDAFDDEDEDEENYSREEQLEGSYKTTNPSIVINRILETYNDLVDVEKSFNYLGAFMKKKNKLRL